MTALNTELNLSAPDDLYEALVTLHHDLTHQQSQRVNAKLILLLMNHIGDRRVLDEAMARALQDIAPRAEDHVTVMDA